MTPEQARAASLTGDWPSLTGRGSDDDATRIKAIPRPAPPAAGGPARPPGLLDGVALDGGRQASLRAAWAREYPRWSALVAQRSQPGGLTAAERDEMGAIAQRQMQRVADAATPAERAVIARNADAHRAWAAARRATGPVGRAP